MFGKNHARLTTSINAVSANDAWLCVGARRDLGTDAASRGLPMQAPSFIDQRMDIEDGLTPYTIW